MLKRDPNGKFMKKGIWIFTQYHFTSGRSQTLEGLSRKQYDQTLSQQWNDPVPVMRNGDSRKTWWMFKKEFYVEDKDFSAYEVKALIIERLRREEHRIQRAISYMEGEQEASVATRISIPDDARIFVWKRDGARCAKCGSQSNLEYDHIIPVSLGGSNTARNLQLLCEKCNRLKGDSLV